jgi:hypothetical protein
VQVSYIVDKKSQSIRFGLILIGNVSLDGSVHEAVLVSVLATEPVNDGRDNSSDVLFIELEVWVITSIITLIKVWGVDEVPV